MSAEVKEWVKVSRSPSGTTVTVSLVMGNFASRYTAKAYASQVKAGLLEARKGAHRMLADLESALSELETAS